MVPNQMGIMALKEEAHMIAGTITKEGKEIKRFHNKS